MSELVVQGDVLDELYDYILETWPTVAAHSAFPLLANSTEQQVSDDDIEVLGDRKGKRSG